MNIIVRISSCLCLLLLLPTFCVAQEKVEISTNPPAPARQWPVIKRLGKARALYDERNNKAVVQTDLAQVQGGDRRNGIRHGIKLRAEFEVPGREVSKPSDVTLSFISVAGDRTYADNRALKILIDGKEALSDVARYKSGNTNGEVFLITVTQDIPYEMFLRLINSKSVKMRIGPSGFELKESDLETLKGL